jgi:adenosine deaminase
MLTARLAMDRVPLTVCPLSNVRLKVVPSMAEHPLRRMMDAGLLVTVNSDDPAYFGGYLAENYIAAAEALELSLKDLAGLAEASFAASFLDEAARLSLTREVRRYADVHKVRTRVRFPIR